MDNQCTICLYRNPAHYIVCGHCSSGLPVSDKDTNADVMSLTDRAAECDEERPTMPCLPVAVKVESAFDFEEYNRTLPNKTKLR